VQQECRFKNPGTVPVRAVVRMGLQPSVLNNVEVTHVVAGFTNERVFYFLPTDKNQLI
jgi:hypothetical protein